MQVGHRTESFEERFSVPRKVRDRVQVTAVGSWAVSIVAIAIALRIVAVALATGHGYDIGVMQSWSHSLIDYSMRSFYGLDLDVPQDHLPGDLLLLAGIGEIFGAIAPEKLSVDSVWVWVIKSVAVIGDAVIGALIGSIAYKLTTPRHALAAMGTFLFAPGVIYVSSVWGQWDVISAAFAVGAMCLLVNQRSFATFAWVVLAYGCLIKPHYVLLAPLFLLFLWKRDGRPGLMSSALGAAIGLGVVQYVSWLFDVGLPGVPARWSLVDRMQATVDQYDAVSLGAHNLWILPIGRGAPFSDESIFVGPVTYQVAGLLLFLLALVAIFWCATRIADPYVGLVWGSTAVMFAMFITMTRMHERYAFPVLPLILLAALLLPRLRVVAVLTHVAYFLNIHVAYTNGPTQVSLLQTDTFYRLNGLCLIALFGAVLVIGICETGSRPVIRQRA